MSCHMSHTFTTICVTSNSMGAFSPATDFDDLLSFAKTRNCLYSSCRLFHIDLLQSSHFIFGAEDGDDGETKVKQNGLVLFVITGHYLSIKFVPREKREGFSFSLCNL